MTCGELEAGIQCGAKILWWPRVGHPWWVLEDGREASSTRGVL